MSHSAPQILYLLTVQVPYPTLQNPEAFALPVLMDPEVLPVLVLRPLLHLCGFLVLLLNLLHLAPLETRPFQETPTALAGPEALALPAVHLALGDLTLP